MARLADTIKKLGAAAVVQINHAGARCFPGEGEMQGASPSGFAFRPDVTALTMNPTQIDQMIVDPESAGKILAGKGSEIIPCEECMTCFATIGRGAAMACKVNRNLPKQTGSGIK
jgi:2,4-dienoyl-CoA reductase-like NADH-dependent reductase (Old Yellow Enzyme family)